MLVDRTIKGIKTDTISWGSENAIEEIVDDLYKKDAESLFIFAGINQNGNLAEEPVDL